MGASCGQPAHAVDTLPSPSKHAAIYVGRLRRLAVSNWEVSGHSTTSHIPSHAPPTPPSPPQHSHSHTTTPATTHTLKQITVKNNIAEDWPNLFEGISIHYHGFSLKGFAWMDGTKYVSQCPIARGTSFTYKFQVRFCLFVGLCAQSQTNNVEGWLQRRVICCLGAAAACCVGHVGTVG